MSKLKLIVIIIIILAVPAAFGIRYLLTPAVPPGHVGIYYFNPALGHLELEWRPIADADLIFETVMHLLFEEPNSSRLTRSWPGNNEVLLGYYLDETTFSVEFAPSYTELTPMQELLFRSALTLTLTRLTGINTVNIRLIDDEGEEREWTESASTIANAPAIPPGMLGTEHFTLFFIDETGESLMTEKFSSSDVDGNEDMVRRFLLERLIEGPTTPGFISMIPPDTRIRSTRRHVGNLYVDFSSEFDLNFSGTEEQAALMLAAITNSLIESSTTSRIQRVFFLIDSERREEFHGVSGFDQAFTFDETVIFGYVPFVEVPIRVTDGENVAEPGE